jgi:hypothetical protein
MDAEIRKHCAEIERCNQRGGRMLSVVDLIEAGTLNVDLAAYSLAAISQGASFMVGALPGGAGKTTVMGALLNFVPPDVQLIPAADDSEIKQGLKSRARRFCYICHEIGSGPYYAYLWNSTLRKYFDLPAAGHMIATNLHADDYEGARRQICAQNNVSAAAFRRMNLIFFLELNQEGWNASRRISEVWESDGEGDHRQVLGAGSIPIIESSRLVSAGNFAKARQIINQFLASGARTIADVRRNFLLSSFQGGL